MKVELFQIGQIAQFRGQGPAQIVFDQEQVSYVAIRVGSYAFPLGQGKLGKPVFSLFRQLGPSVAT